MYSRVYVEITNICNMACSFCHGHQRPSRQMSREDFSKVLSALRGKTDYIYYHLMGEPLTHPDLPEFLQMAKSRGFRSVITTNGTLLHKRGAQILAAGVHKVSISLHSFEEGGEKQMQSYVNQVADFADAASRQGVIVSLRLWNRGCDGGKNREIEGILKERFPAPWTENTRGYRLRDKLFLGWDDRFSWPDRDADETGDRVFCYGLSDHFGILSDGTVVPCCLDSDGVINLGNVFTQDLSEILSGVRAGAMVTGFREGRGVEPLCRRCGYARRFR